MRKKLKILFALNHPAHVHLFKNLIFKLKDDGFDIHIIARDKDVTLKLLEHYNLKYDTMPVRRGPFHNVIELLIRDIHLAMQNRRYKFAFGIGTDVSITHILKRSYFFAEDDDDTVPVGSWITYPFAYKIIIPDCIIYRRWRGKRVIHNSYHELAYLHPNNFTPDRGILEKYGLKERKYIVVRFSAFQAYHDKQARGISRGLWDDIAVLLDEYKIVKSFEHTDTHQIEPWDMHHILAFAKMIISDSQTMTAEAAVLGRPAVRCNTFVGRLAYLEELEHKYKLAVGILPDKEDDILRTVRSILDDPETDKIWAERRAQLLKEKVDFNQWMIDFFENLEEVGTAGNVK